MASQPSRTATGKHRRWRKRILQAEQTRGITNCPICNTKLDYNHSMQPNSAEPDHIIAHKYGGGYTLDNGRAICRRCNQSRGDGTNDARRGMQPKQITTDLQW